MAEAVLLVASIVVSVGTALILLRRTRNPTWVRDTFLSLNASPGLTWTWIAVQSLVVTGALVFGIVVIAGDHVIAGWAIVAVALAGAAHAGVLVWVLRRPRT